jgi:hypothetical protein
VHTAEGSGDTRESIQDAPIRARVAAKRRVVGVVLEGERLEVVCLTNSGQRAGKASIIPEVVHLHERRPTKALGGHESVRR